MLAIAMSLLRSSLHRQFGFHAPSPFPLTSHQSLHSSAPTCKKFKPQKPFLMPGQTPGQQRAERKRLEAAQKAAKRFSGKDNLGFTPTRVGFTQRSSSSNRDPDRFGMKEGSGRAPVASGSSSRPSWDAREQGDSDRPHSPPRRHLNHNRMDTSKPFVPRHLRRKDELLDLDDEHESISPIGPRPKRLDLDWTEDPVDVPLVASRKRSSVNDESPSSPKPDREQYSYGLSRTHDGILTGRAEPRNLGRSFPHQTSSSGRRFYATSSAFPAQDDGFVVRAPFPASTSTASIDAKSKESHPTSTSTSEHDWRTPSQSDYARYDRMRARAKMGRSGTTFPARDGERKNGRPHRPFTPRAVSDKPMVRRDETQRVGQREDDYSRPFRPARMTDSGRAHRENRVGPSSMSAPFGASSVRAAAAETPSSSFVTTPEDRPDSRWAPTKRLSRPAMQGIQDLHRQDPIKYSRAALSKGFGVSVEAITRILKSDGRWIKRDVAEEGK